MRSTLSPTFSGAKLKQMTPIIESAIDQFVNRVEEHKKLDKEIDIYDLAQDLTMDTIAKSGFGFDSGAQTETERQVINAAKKSFQVQVSQFFLFISFLFPEFLWVINPFRLVAEMISDYLGQSSRGFLLKVSDQLIKQRREQKGDKQKDLLQMMIESEGTDILSNDKLSVSSDMNNDTVVDSNVRINKKTKMTDDEIAANSVLFFEAGYETTSTALGYLMHILINKPEIQEKCRQEVKQLLESEGRLDYNTVTKLKYMESVIYETLRIYPPITTFISRMPKTDYPYNGLTLPKGVDLRVPLYFLQKDPELWSEPEEFIPERFSDENKHLINPVVWQPFGTGPRNCIGMRFALLEMKLSMAKLLNQYAFIPSPNTELGDIQRDFKVISMTPKNGVFTKAVDISS
ncbi:unnamed protein product [Medioppia subpectinata]|uniref:Cytochrome P450 n=2 Tax=Medioppia subpectinata TaxID=1979941 RepID=A0A7R9KZJ1_9ACAR|nr:unnamed protein product [Medioppia subpectinata]CAG2112810.1 unnamed protein product [Medioppia subpectinata]